MLVWNEAKRKANIRKHGLDFQDACLVYDNPGKCTYESHRPEESRWMDIAMAMIHGQLLTLIYTRRGDDIRVISFRPASREERKQYEEDSK
ncbi:MAG TPA: BrnT family toxin [Terracidiphilus sp.]|nr:BrnT family toxin [Terracidiphilus sp.]